MIVTKQLQERVIQRLKSDIATAEKKYGITIKFPTIRYAKGGTTAGTADYRNWILNFNPTLLVENEDAFINRTVPHELAHLITELVYPHAHRRGFGQKRSPHGVEWQSIMHVLGADASRCHSYDVSNARRRKSTSTEVFCQGCGAEMTVGPKRLASLNSLWHKPCGRHGGRLAVKGTGVQALLNVVPPVAKPVVKTPMKAVLTPGSKIAVCKQLFDQHPGMSRGQMIDLFIAKANCTKAGASTYYNTCKNG